jgi:prepilin signal peptidase PulO-like enzyme (type II secretory pathway)
MMKKGSIWLVLGLLVLFCVLFCGAGLVFKTWSYSDQYTACRQLPGLTHGEIVINCGPFLRTTLMWGVLCVATLAAGVWATVRAFRLDRAAAKSLTPIGKESADPADSTLPAGTT